MEDNLGYGTPSPDPSDQPSGVPGDSVGYGDGAYSGDYDLGGGGPSPDDDMAGPPGRRRRRALWPVALLSGGIALILALAAIGLWVIRPRIVARRTEKQTAVAQLATVTATAGEARGVPVVPATSQPGTVATAMPVSEAAAIASYDAEGSLESVSGPAGEPIAGGVAAGFPPSLERSEEYIPLSAAGEALGQLTVLEGAAYDAESGELIMVGRSVPGEPPLRADDLLVALLSVTAGEYPGVSIDPGPSREEMKVRYIGPTEKTGFGETMFEADRLLKTLGAGQDNLTGEAVTSAVPGFRTELGLAAEYGQFTSAPDPVWHRFWYVVDRMRVGLSEDGQEMSFLEARLKVNTEYMGQDFQSMPDHPPDPEAQAFADHFSAHFSEFAAEFPVVRRLEELAKMVSLAQWMTDQEISLDPTWLTMQAAAHVGTPVTTPAITASRTLTRTTGSLIETWTVSLYGGVDLSVRNEYETVGPMLSAEAMGARPSAEAAAWSFPAHTDGRERRAAAVALSPVERLTVALFPAVDDVGVSELGSLGLPYARQYRAADPEAGALGYGWQLPLSRLEFPLPAQQFTAQDGSGKVYSVYPEVVLFEAVRRQRRRYELAGFREPDGAAVYRAGNGDELVLLADGSYTLSGGAGELSFDVLGQLVRAVDATGNRAEYQYTDGRLTRVETSSGVRIDLSYEAGRISQVTSGTRTLYYRYDGRGDLVEVVDGQGQVAWRYSYDTGHHLVREEEVLTGVERRFVYDEAGRIVAFGSPIGDYEVEFLPGGRVTLTFYRPLVDRPIQTVAQARPELLTGDGVQGFRQAFGPQFDSDLTLYQQLRADARLPSGTTVVYAARPGARQLVLLVGDKLVTLSVRDAAYPEVLRSKLEAAGALPAEGPLLVVGPAQVVADLRGALPGREVVYAEGLDATQIASNWQALRAEGPLTPETTTIFNGVPRSVAEMQAMGFGPEEFDRGWRGLAQTWEDLVQSAGYRVAGREGGMAAAIQAALETSRTTITVFAHSDGTSIYLPDGTVLSPSGFDSATRERIRQNRPKIILVSCETARITDTRSLAKELIDKGAMAVVAPEVEVSALSTKGFLDSLLRNPGNHARLLDVVNRAIEDASAGDPTIRFFKPVIGELLRRLGLG